MKKFITTFFFFSAICLSVYSQSTKDSTALRNQFRITFIHPGVEYEARLNNSFTASGQAGIGYGGSFKNLSYNLPNGFLYLISPFVDLQCKYFYNQNKRIRKQKRTKNNSGNFLSIRFLSRGNTIKSNFERTSNWDYSVGATWGMQRSYGQINLLFDIGPYYYFDGKGNNGVFPLLFQLNIGYNMLK